MDGDKLKQVISELNGRNIQKLIDKGGQRWSKGGWSQSAPNKSKMADGRHFEKTVKSLYLCNRLTDFDKIWYSDAY